MTFKPLYNTVVFVISENDPNREKYIIPSVDYALKNIKKEVFFIIITEGQPDFPDHWETLDNVTIASFPNAFRNLNEALLQLRNSIKPGLLFLPFPGNAVFIDNKTIDGFVQAFKNGTGDLLLSWHFQINDKKTLQKIKHGDDPSNIIIPSRTNSPVWFYHGSLFVIDTKLLHGDIFDIEVNYGFDYAIRMGVLGTGKKIGVIASPLYSYQAGIPFYPGRGLQNKLEKRLGSEISTHFSYTQDPARLEWGKITFRKYLKRIGAYLPEEYFCRDVPSDNNLSDGISFVVPTFNRGHLIRYAVESVLKVRKIVNNIPVEMIIVDNGDDNTEEIVKSFSDRYPELIRYFKVSGFTLGGTRNYGVMQARNRIIGQLDSDDQLTGDPVTGIVRLFKETGAAMVVGTYYTARREVSTGELSIDRTPITHDEFLVHDKNPLLQICIPGPGAPRYYRKEALQIVGGFPHISYGEDSVLSDSLIKNGFRVIRDLSEPKYIAVRHESNTDSSQTSPEELIRLNYSKYIFKKPLLEELKHIVAANPSLHKYNDNILS